MIKFIKYSLLLASKYLQPLEAKSHPLQRDEKLL